MRSDCRLYEAPFDSSPRLRSKSRPEWDGFFVVTLKVSQRIICDMMLHLALLASSASIDMAYNIRRYKQGDAKSYHQIYIANHNGSGIKRVSKGNQIHAVSPIWIDRNHLAWVEQFDPAPIKNDPNIYFRDCKARIMVYDLASKATKKLADLPTLSWREYPRASGR